MNTIVSATPIRKRLAFTIPFSPLALAVILMLFQVVSADQLRTMAEFVLPVSGSIAAFLPLPSDTASASVGTSQINAAIHPVTIFMIGFCVAALVVETALGLLTFGPDLPHIAARYQQFLDNSPASFKPPSRKTFWIIAVGTGLVIFDFMFFGYSWGIILFRETDIPRGVLGILIRLGMIFTSLSWAVLAIQGGFFLFLSRKLERLRKRSSESAP